MPQSQGIVGTLKKIRHKKKPGLKIWEDEFTKITTKGLKTYVTGSVSSGFTRGATETMLVSALMFFPVAPVSLSFLTFLREPLCFPPSEFLFCSKIQLKKKIQQYRNMIYKATEILMTMNTDMHSGTKQ